MRKELKLDGIGNANGGEYELVNISGIGKLYKNISSKKFIVSGIAKSKKSIDTEELIVDGILKIEEDLKILKGIINGIVKNKKNISAETLEVNGVLKTDNLEVEDINVLGSIKVNNNCQGEEFNAEGKIAIKGLLSGEKVNIKSEILSRIKEVGGTSIRIEKAETKVLEKLIFWKSYNIDIDLIEGDNIFLENVRCNLVRGRKIEIGKGCKIKKIEYTEEAILSKESKIKECIRG